MVSPDCLLVMSLEKILFVLLAIQSSQCHPTPEADAYLRVIRKGEEVFGNMKPAVLVLTFNIGKAPRNASWQQGVLLRKDLVVTAEKNGSKVNFGGGEKIFVVSGVEKMGGYGKFVAEWNDRKVCLEKNTVECVKKGLEEVDGDGKVVIVSKGDEIAGALVPGVGGWITLSLTEDAKGSPMSIYTEDVLQRRPGMKISYLGESKVIDLVQTEITPCENNTSYFCTLGTNPTVDHAVGSPLLCSYVDFRDTGQVCGVYLHTKDKKNQYLRMDVYKNLFTTTLPTTTTAITTTPSTTVSTAPTTTPNMTTSTDTSNTTVSTTPMTPAVTPNATKPPTKPLASTRPTSKLPTLVQDEKLSFRKMGDLRVVEAERGIPTRWNVPVTANYPRKAFRKDGAVALQMGWVIIILNQLL